AHIKRWFGLGIRIKVVHFGVRHRIDGHMLCDNSISIKCNYDD
ncbi:MAG: hypothetical protein ACI8P9_003363, partial [Parasphingorhabdus sp.]